MTRTRVSMPSLIHGVSQLSAAERQPVHALACDNVWLTAEHGSQKRPPLIHVKKVFSGIFADPYCHGIDRGTAGSEQYIALLRFQAGVNSGLVFDLAGNVIPVFRNTNTYAAPAYDACQYLYLNSGGTPFTEPTRNIRALSVLDYTFITNRQAAVTMASTLTTAAPTNTAHVFIRQGVFAMKYTVKIRNGTATEYTLHASTRGDISTDFDHPAVYDAVHGHHVWDQEKPAPVGSSNIAITSVKTQDIAYALEQRIAGNPDADFGSNVALINSFTVTRSGSVLKIVANTGGGLPAANTGVITTFEVSTSQGDQLAFGIQNDTSAFSSLPLIFTHDYVVKIKGNSLADEDDFWVKFTSDTASASLSKGSWSEAAKPGIPFTWTYTASAAHPHALIRRFYDAAVGAATVGVSGTDKCFSFEPINLSSRAVGDLTSNQNPTFVSVTGTYLGPGGGGVSTSFPVIRRVFDFAFFRDRLVFSCDDGISASEQGVYFNFLRTTVRALPDSDPINVRVVSDRVTHTLISYNGKLSMFSEELQSQLSGAPSLTPSTVENNEASRYHATDRCKPAAYKDGIVFPAISGGFSTLKSLAPTPGTEHNFTATDLSIHTPSYIPGNIRQLVVSADSSIMACLTHGDLDAIYILKQHREGDQVIQSAWMRFLVEDATILGIWFFGTKLYVATQRAVIDAPPGPALYTEVACGGYHARAIKSDGSEVTWGDNTGGAGNLIVFPGGVVASKVACGNSHSLVLGTNGLCYAVGDNSFGQCNVPALTGGLTYTQLAGGFQHSAAVRSDGAIVAWGDNSQGQLGIAGAAITSNVITPPVGLTYVEVKCGGFHTIARLSDGTTSGWGYNIAGQKNSPPLPGGLTYVGIAAGHLYSLWLRSDGNAFSTGSSGGNGATNIPPLSGGLTFAGVSAFHYGPSLFLKSNGTLVATGSAAFNETIVPALPGGLTYTKIASGRYFGAALRSDGMIVAWGSNNFGQCNVPSPFGDDAAATADNVYLEYIDLAAGVSDETRDYWLHLDRRVSNTTSGVSIAYAAGITTVTVPYEIEPNAIMELVETASGARYFGTVLSATTFSVFANLTGAAFVCGRQYESVHSFHKPQVTVDERSGRRMVLDSTSAVVSLSLRYENTDYFTVRVGSHTKFVGSPGYVSLGGASSTVEPRSGTVVAGVGGRLDVPFDVSVRNTSPFPHTLVSGEWILNANIRSPALHG